MNYIGMHQSNGVTQPFIIFATKKNLKKYYVVKFARCEKFVVPVNIILNVEKLRKYENV